MRTPTIRTARTTATSEPFAMTVVLELEDRIEAALFGDAEIRTC